MKKEDLYNLIKKYNAGTASDEEKKLIEQWYEHLQTPIKEVEEATVQYKKEQAFQHLGQNMSFGQSASRIRQIYRWLGTTAAIAALLLLLTYPLYKKLDGEIGSQQIAGNQTILPGSTKAELILPDGQRIDVSTLDEKKIHELYSTLAMSQSPSPNKSDKKYELIVPKGGEFKFVLPDGTKVWINSLSKLSFSDFGQKPERRVHLEGEAYFEVAKNKHKPFYVNTKDAQVKVLGTHFNVRAYENHTRTTLVEGSVSFSNQQQNIVLTPGQFVENTNSTLKADLADISRETAWKNEEFYFKQDDIKYITDQLERWYDITLEFDKDIPTQTGYTGRIKRTATLQEVVEMLNYVMDVKMEIKGKKLLVKKK